MWQARRIVGEVGIHLDDDVIGVSQGPLEASDVGCPEAQFTSAGEEMHLVSILVLHQRDLFLRTVLAIVIHKQDVNGGSCLHNGCDEGCNVVSFVIGGDNNQRTRFERRRHESSSRRVPEDWPGCIGLSDARGRYRSVDEDTLESINQARFLL